jgi:hypothetical protein
LGVRIHFISGEKHATGRGAAILAVSLAVPAVPSRPYSCLLVCALGCGGGREIDLKNAVRPAFVQLRAIGEQATVQQKPEHVVAPVATGVSAMAMAFQRQEALYHRLYWH